MRIKMFSLLACSVAVTAWIGFQSTTDGNTTAQRRSAASMPASISRPVDALARKQLPSSEQLKRHYQEFMANPPAYLAGIDLPGRYSTDADGNLIIDAGMKEMLDFFFLGVGDLSFEEIHDLIAGSMIDALHEPARTQALAFLDRYFSYIDSYDQWQQSFDRNDTVANDPADMQRRLAELESLRRQQLGDEAYDAFFAESDQINSAWLQAQAAMRHPDLTPDDKAAIRDQLEQALPAPVREAQQAAMTLLTLEAATDRLKGKGASDTDIFQARAALVGEEAAQRLAQVDDEQRAWTQKRSQYQQLIRSTPELGNLPAEEQQHYIADLAQRELGLSANEVNRMQALDRIDAAGTHAQPH